MSNRGCEGVVGLPRELGLGGENGVGGYVVAEIGGDRGALEGNGVAPEVNT